MNPKSLLSIALLSITMLAAPAAFAKNVDLSTVPQRNTVQLTIYNSEDLTLVRETRAVTFKKGRQSTAVLLGQHADRPHLGAASIPQQPGKAGVLDTTFPHDKPQMLYWNVQSDFDGEATLEITYFTSGITWSADYLCVADKDEKQMSLEGFVRVTNHSRRRIRRRPGAAGGRHHQPGGEDRGAGADSDERGGRAGEDTAGRIAAKGRRRQRWRLRSRRSRR